MKNKVMELMNTQMEARNVLALEIIEEAKESLKILGLEDLLNTSVATVTREVEVVKYVDRVVNNNNITVVKGDTYVLFAWNSAELDATAKTTLDKVSGTVTVVAYASPEGTESYNKELSQRRANAVADYLRAKGVTVTEAYGAGVNGNTSNRVAIVTVH